MPTDTEVATSTEALRLRALEAYRIMDTDPEPLFDDITAVAAELCGTPIALISLLDDHRQWFKARHGLDVTETPRAIAFCDYTIRTPEPLVVPDATQDARFAGNPLVTGDMHVRFYAGAPLRTPDGHGLGSLCVVDSTPRTLTEGQVGALQALSRQVVALLEARRVSAQLAEALEASRTLARLLPICAHCKRIRDDDAYWQEVETYLGTHAGATFTHGLCPSCEQRYFPR